MVQHGNEDKNPLLVLVGMPGSGKSSVAGYLRERGWHIIRFGEITMRELKSRGLPVNEANEKAIREELRVSGGMDAYARLSLTEITEMLLRKPVVVDGLYSWSEYKFLRSQFGKRMKVVAIYTTRDMRYRRLGNRPERPLTALESEQRDIAEIENLEKAGPIAMADCTIVNDGTEEDLYNNIEKLISTFA